jgi:hypothetical protein
VIEDLFFKRYKDFVFAYDHVLPNMSRVLVQAAQIFADDVCTSLDLDDKCFLSAERQLIRECGYNPFPLYQSPFDRCEAFLTEPYDLWNDQHGTPDLFVKLRLSLIELLYRDAERAAAERASAIARQPNVPAGLRRVGRGPRATRGGLPTEEELPGVVSSAIRELNARFREAGVILHYHNGRIQLAADDLSQERIAEPFWSIIRDPKWANVDHDMKVAVDLADTGGQDPVLYATMALESTIKIISDEKRWTTGTERGAANYIDNLVSQRNGRFIDSWEADALKAIFSKLRNPHGHGPGSAPQPTLNEHQTTWAIETCMSWIKSLIRRL